MGINKYGEKRVIHFKSKSYSLDNFINVFFYKSKLIDTGVLSIRFTAK